MKRYLVLLISLFASPLLADDAELEAVRAKIAEKIQTLEAKHVDHGPIDGWYKVQKGSIVGYVSADGRYLMQGELIDLDAGINLSEVARDEARRDLFADLDNSQVIAFTPDEVRHSVTIFTDVDCGFCRRLHAQIDEYLELGIEVRYLLYPRGGPPSPSWITSENIWCASDRNSALTAAKLGRSFETHKCDSSIVSDHFVLGQNAGLSGTPAIVFEDGSLVSGYLPPAALNQRLEQMAEARTRD